MSPQSDGAYSDGFDDAASSPALSEMSPLGAATSAQAHGGGRLGAQGAGAAGAAGAGAGALPAYEIAEEDIVEEEEFGGGSRSSDLGAF